TTLLPQSVFAQESVHVVSRGEKLAQIARRYGVTLEQMVAANGLEDPNHIWVGQQLSVPGAGGLAAAAVGGPATGGESYVVGPGDTLSEIAKRFGLAPSELMRLNALSDPNFVWVGQRLQVSGSAAAAANVPLAAASGGDIYVVKPGDTLSEIARDLGISVQQLLSANGLPNANFVWVGQRLQTGGSAVTAAQASAAAPNGVRWIEVNLSNQTLTAWQGDVAVLYTSISSGLSATPTVTGRFNIGVKYDSQRMTGPGYDLPGVPWVMYFYGSYAIHGAYWHNNFGVPMSRGCVNTPIPDAEFLYGWAPEGTEVWVHY
ncbi:MAG: LysM peptidoglycan-binding domain-containing protein, partial [Caldilineaceae bacterium]